MKKYIALLTSLCFSLAQAQNYSWDDPSKSFDATKNFTSKVEIVWVVSDNPTKACNAEASRRYKDFKGYGYNPEACAFWDEENKNKCMIITKKRPTMHDLGHEVRHCFQGHWH